MQYYLVLYCLVRSERRSIYGSVEVFDEEEG